MSYPDDDSCPRCGQNNGSGHPCSVCPWHCPECDYLGDHTDGCKMCKVLEFIGDLDSEGEEILFEEVEQLKRKRDEERKEKMWHVWMRSVKNH